MRSDRAMALRLRLSGKSYGEIQKELGVPKSTLSGWLSGVILAPEKRQRIEAKAYYKSREALIRRNKQQTELAKKRALLTRQEAAHDINSLTKKDLVILGAALYWAEGYKRLQVRNGREITAHAVSLTNSDPLLVRAFIRFLREYCEVPITKIKMGLRMFKHQNENHLKRYWHKATGIPLENFQKTYLGISKSSMGKRPFNRLEYGIVQVVVADTKLFHRIMGYIEGLKKVV